MNAGTKLAALNKFRSSASVMMRQPVTKVLVVYDVQVKTPEVSHTPLIINYGMWMRFLHLPSTNKFIFNLKTYLRLLKNTRIGMSEPLSLLFLGF